SEQPMLSAQAAPIRQSERASEWFRMLCSLEWSGFGLSVFGSGLRLRSCWASASALNPRLRLAFHRDPHAIANRADDALQLGGGHQHFARHDFIELEHGLCLAILWIGGEEFAESKGVVHHDQ